MWILLICYQTLVRKCWDIMVITSFGILYWYVVVKAAMIFMDFHANSATNVRKFIIVMIKIHFKWFISRTDCLYTSVVVLDLKTWLSHYNITCIYTWDILSMCFIHTHIIHCVKLEFHSILLFCFAKTLHCVHFNTHCYKIIRLYAYLHVLIYW